MGEVIEVPNDHLPWLPNDWLVDPKLFYQVCSALYTKITAKQDVLDFTPVYVREDITEEFFYDKSKSVCYDVILELKQILEYTVSHPGGGEEIGYYYNWCTEEGELYDGPTILKASILINVPSATGDLGKASIAPQFWNKFLLDAKDFIDNLLYLVQNIYAARLIPVSGVHRTIINWDSEKVNAKDYGFIQSSILYPGLPDDPPNGTNMWSEMVSGPGKDFRLDLSESSPIWGIHNRYPIHAACYIGSSRWGIGNDDDYYYWTGKKTGCAIRLPHTGFGGTIINRNTRVAVKLVATCSPENANASFNGWGFGYDYITEGDYTGNRDLDLSSEYSWIEGTDTDGSSIKELIFFAELPAGEHKYISVTFDIVNHQEDRWYANISGDMVSNSIYIELEAFMYVKMEGLEDWVSITSRS